MTQDHVLREVEDVEYGDLIRPEGWYHFYEVIGVEDTAVPEFVVVLWFVGDGRRNPSPWPPGPTTYFMRGEKVEVTR